LIALTSALTPALTPAYAEEPLKEPLIEAEPYMPSTEEMRRMPMRMPILTPPPGLMARDAAGLIDTRGDHDLLIGTLQLAESGHPGHPADYCLEDGKRWQGADFRMMDAPVFGLLRSKRVSDMAGEVVLVAAERKDDITTQIVDEGPCPEGYGEPWRMMQWRDDWTAPEGRRLYRSGPGATDTAPWSHARLKTLSYFQTEGWVEPLEVVQVEVIDKKGGSVAAVTLHNPLNAPLTLPVVLHYEGGPGKPTPRYEQVQVNVKPGERHTFTAPLTLTEEDPDTKAGRRGMHRLQSVEVRGAVGRVTLDIRQPVR
jgi:hypothetical protein